MKTPFVKRLFLFLLCVSVATLFLSPLAATARADEKVELKPEPLEGFYDYLRGTGLNDQGIADLLKDEAQLDDQLRNFKSYKKSQNAAATQGFLDKDWINEFLKAIEKSLEKDSVKNTLSDYALQVFWVMAAIEIFLAVYDFVSRGDYAVNGWASLLIRQVIVVSFFYWLIGNASTFFGDIIQWFKEGGMTAGGTSMSNFTIGRVVQEGLTVSTSLISKAWDIEGKAGFAALGAMIASVIPLFVILYSFSYMALTYIAIAVQGYFAVTLGMFVVGAGGSRLSRDVAVNAIRTVIGMGLKMFTVILLIGMAMSFTEEWTKTITGMESEFDSVLGMAFKVSSISAILAGMVKELPSFAGSFISSNAGSGGNASVLASAMIASGALMTRTEKLGGRSILGTASTLFGNNVGHPIHALQNNRHGGLIGGLVHAGVKFSSEFGKRNGSNNDIKSGSST